MNQPWSYPDFPNPPTASSQGERKAPSAAQSDPIDEGNRNPNPPDETNPYIWYPQASWDVSNPPFPAYHHTSLGDPIEPPNTNPIAQDLDAQAYQQLSSNSSEYGSIYTPPTTFASGGFDERPTRQVSQHQFQFSRDLEGSMSAGPLGSEAAATSSSSLLDPTGHHHFLRGRGAEDLNSERVSSVERRRNQNRASQRAFRKRKEERLKELESIVGELETKVKSLEDRNRELEARNGSVEGRNRDLLGRMGALEEELEGLRARGLR